MTPRLFLYQGAGRSIREIARMVGMKPSTLHFRLCVKGMSVSDAIAMPITPKHRLNPEGRQPRLYEFRGQMLDAKAIAILIGRHRDTVYRRVVGNRVLDIGETPDPFSGFQDAPSTALLITHDGETLPAAEWARRTGISRETIYSRIAYGWHPVDAITTPPDARYTMRTIKVRNLRIIRRIASTFRPSTTMTGGYAGTFANPLGTGVGRHAHHLQSGETA